MTIHLPEDLETSILAQVRSGRFASLDDAMAEAARLLLQKIGNTSQPAGPASGPDPALGSIGAMRDAAEEPDEIVADAMRRRREQPGRVIAGE